MSWIKGETIWLCGQEYAEFKLMQNGRARRQIDMGSSSSERAEIRRTTSERCNKEGKEPRKETHLPHHRYATISGYQPWSHSGDIIHIILTFSAQALGYG